MNDVTVLLLNWKREDNLKKIIENLKKQTIKPKIYLWDNNPNSTIKSDSVDLYVKSTFNTIYGRWLLSSLATTEYVMTLDDDLIPKNNTFIHNTIIEYKKHNCLILGMEGKKTPNNPPYYKNVSDTTGYADIIKGKFMFMRTELIKKVNLKPSCNVYREDDIYVSFMIAQGKQAPHYVSRELRVMLDILPDGNVSLEQDKMHFEDRELALKTLIEVIPGNKNHKRFCELVEEITPSTLSKSIINPKYPEEYLSEILYKLKPKKILEIGTHKGITTTYLANFNFVQKVITIDSNRKDKGNILWNKFDVNHKIHELKINNAVEKVKWINQFAPYDLVLINTIHSELDFKEDFKLVKGKTKHIIFYNSGYYNKSLNTFIKENRSDIIETKIDPFFLIWKKPKS